MALLYAEPNRTLGLIGRNNDRLEAVAKRCRDKGAQVVTGILDVTDLPTFTAWAKTFDAEHPIDLLVVNAGAFSGNGANGAPETFGELTLLLRTNLEGAASTIAAVLPMMRERKNGRIAIVGSLAALQPLADAPAYSASKAGVMSYGEALREWLLPDNVSVSLIYPGHIQTAQVAHHVGALPLIISADAAARRIKRDLDRGRSFIAFPRRLLWLIRLGRMVPWRTRAHFGKSMRFHVSKDEV